MKKKIGFDHRIGDENVQLNEKDLKIYQRIIKSHSNEQSIEDKRFIKHISLRLEMEAYLESTNPHITVAGSFLEQLLIIYDVQKSQFAEFIGLEKTNLYALLKGRRKFNNVIATKIGEIFNIDPELWLFIEAKNEMKAYLFQCNVQEDKQEYKLANLLKKRK